MNCWLMKSCLELLQIFILSAEGNDSDTEQFVDCLVNTAHKLRRHFGYLSIISFTWPKSDDISLMLCSIQQCLYGNLGSTWLGGWWVLLLLMTPGLHGLLSFLLLFMWVQHAFSPCHLDRIQFVSNKKITHFSFHWKMRTETWISLQ